jgi:hypothetical protein
MSCDCVQCREHYRTLGIAYGIPTEDAIEAAYHEAVKQWHPDLYENFPSLRADAEEHFKAIQVAYREVKEHSGGAAAAPVESATVKPVETPFSDPFAAPFSDPFSAPSSAPFSASASAPFTDPFAAPASASFFSSSSEPSPSPFSAASSAPAFTQPSVPAISFNEAPGCQVGPQFTPEAEEIISRHLGKLGAPLAIVDLGGACPHGASYSQFLLLASNGILARDPRQNISLLWYRDLGEVILIDRHKSAKSGFSHKFFGALAGDQPPKYELQIYRSNGKHFFSVIDPVDDQVKKVIYDFLLAHKPQVQP